MIELGVLVHSIRHVVLDNERDSGLGNPLMSLDWPQSPHRLNEIDCFYGGLFLVIRTCAPSDIMKSQLGETYQLKHSKNICQLNTVY